MNIIDTLRNGFDFSFLTNLLMMVVPAMLCITLHELSHGLAALALGDRTAKDQGRLTLNPIRHIDPMGLFMILFFRIGWAKPVPVNPYNFKDPKKGMALCALAGPAANVVLAAVALFFYGLSYTTLAHTLQDFLLTTATLSLYLAIFNLIPIPPLDGSKLLFSFLPDKAYAQVLRYERFGMILLFAVIFTDVLDQGLYNAFDFFLNKLFVLAELGHSIAVRFLV